jgi:VWFA-related protein
VDVAVRDADGRPVRGLRTEDFTILDRKRPQPIAAFSEISHDRGDSSPLPVPPDMVKADVADNATAKSERVVILVIHDLGLWRDRVEPVKALARRIVTELGPHASMALLFSSGRGGVELTEDRAALLEGIETLQGQYYSARRGTSYFRRTIQDVATYLRTEEARRKAVVVITEGGGGDALGLFDLMRPRPHPVDPISNPGYWRWSDIELLNMMEALRRSHVTLYAIDPRGRLQTPEERARESRGSNDGLRMNDSLYLSQEALTLTAEASGGFAVVDTNELDAGLDRIMADLDHYYLIGFDPPDPGDRSWRELDVRVNRPGALVRHRVGYRVTKPPEPPRQVDPLVALSVGVLPKTALPLRSFATPVALSTTQAHVEVVVEFRAQAADLASGGSMRDRVRVTVLAADLKKKKVTKRTSRNATVAIPASRFLNSATATY